MGKSAQFQPTEHPKPPHTKTRDTVDWVVDGYRFFLLNSKNKIWCRCFVTENKPAEQPKWSAAEPWRGTTSQPSQSHTFLAYKRAEPPKLPDPEIHPYTFPQSNKTNHWAQRLVDEGRPEELGPCTRGTPFVHGKPMSAG